MVKIVTDTLSGLPAEFARRYNIPVIPQVIIFGTDSYLEGVEIDNATFMQRLKTSRELPKTAAPSPEMFVEEFQRLVPAGEPILCIHPSTEVSGTVRSAIVAAKEFPGADIRVIDTRIIGSPLATMVQLAAEWAAAGLDADTIEARLRDMTPRCRIYFVVAMLEYLAKGGRIGGAAALLGSVLQVKPILTFRDGRVDQFERERTQKRALARALFKAVCDWVRSRGLERVIGPKGFLQGDGMGLLVEGFEHRPAVGIPYNYPYYDALVAGSGFEKETDFVSGYLPGDYELPQRFYDIAEKVKARRGFWIKSFASEKELRQWVSRIGKVYNATFTDNWEYCPITAEEMTIIGERLIAIADPRLIKLVVKGEEIAGFVFGFPDISAAIQRTKGRIWPFGWIDLMREFKRTDWVNFNGTGLLASYRGVGANAVLYTELAKSVRDFHFKHADVVQVEERNAKSLGDMEATGVRWHKRHRIYRRAV